MRNPKIVPIPEKMEKFYGKGQMLHPEMDMVTSLIDLIPQGKVSTIDSLTNKLAVLYGTDVTCPMRTSNLLKKLSKTETETPFWRIIKKDHVMVKIDAYEYWASILEKEGLSLEFTKSNQIKILATEDQLFQF